MKRSWELKDPLKTERKPKEKMGAQHNQYGALDKLKMGRVNKKKMTVHFIKLFFETMIRVSLNVRSD